MLPEPESRCHEEGEGREQRCLLVFDIALVACVGTLHKNFESADMLSFVGEIGFL